MFQSQQYKHWNKTWGWGERKMETNKKLKHEKHNHW